MEICLLAILGGEVELVVTVVAVVVGRHCSVFGEAVAW